MSVLIQHDLISLFNGMTLRINHFAEGTYPCGGQLSSYPVNRLLLIRKNPNKKNSISDETEFHELEEGVFYFIPAFHPADVSFDDEVFFLSLQSSLELFYGNDICSVLNHLIVFRDPVLAEDLLRLYRNRTELKTAAELHSIVWNFYSRILEHITGETLFQAEHWKRYRKLVEHMNTHGSAQVTIDFCAELMDMRREAFSRAFTRDVGLTPKQFLTRCLLRKSCELLQCPNLTVRVVAERLKFSSEYYFSRFFKKHAGVPPHHYQQEFRQRHEPME